MKLIYYIYSHVRLDTNQVFYIGFGTSKDGTFQRANDLREKKRNFMWSNLFNHCHGNIKVEILHTYSKKEEALSKEIELIKMYGKMIDKKGGLLVNLSDGGEYCGTGARKVIQYNLTEGKPLKIWNSTIECSKKIGCTFKSIHSAISRKGSCMGYQFRWLDEDTVGLKHIGRFDDKMRRRVNKFDLMGRFIQSYNSLGEASKDTGIDRSSINHCALGTCGRSSCGGFMWSYLDAKDPKVYTGYIITQYDMNMNKMEDFYSMAKVVERLKLPSSTAIRNCFVGKQKQAYGFLWRKTVL